MSGKQLILVEDLISDKKIVFQDLLNQKKFTVLNCGYGKGFSVKEVLKIVNEIQNLNIYHLKIIYDQVKDILKIKNFLF